MSNDNKGINTTKYKKLRERWNKIYNEFPMGFAFSEDQLQDEMKRLGVKSKDELISIQVSGGFIRKTDLKDFEAMIKKVHDEQVKARDDDEYVYQMFVSEMGNHEYQLTYDIEDVLLGCNMTMSDLKDKRIFDILKKAEKDFIAECNKYDLY